MPPPTLVRDRTDADIEACLGMARATYVRDRYPAFLPTDLRGFVVSPDAVGAWVAEQSGTIVGHVALHRRTLSPLMTLAREALGRPDAQLGVVARLFVGPSARRSGAGRALLEVASQEAVTRGLWPILDVAVHLHAAVAMYENAGWRRLGATTVWLDGDLSLDEYVYLGPLAPEPGT